MGRRSQARSGQTTAGKRKSPVESRRQLRRWRPRLLVGLVLLVLGGAGAWVLADWWLCLPDDAQATYVGRSSCVECHAAEVEQWTGSDHDRAMDVATDETVLADFNDVEFTHHGVVSRMYRDGSKFMVYTEGPDGKMADFEVKYVFGIRPLQQYMVEFDRPADMPASEIARVQVLRLSWDTEKNQWFYLPPPDVPEKLDPSDVLHWTGMAQCWNTMCAYCHSTDLQKNFDVETLTYHTTFSEIDVSCEACHGPASLHVELANKKSLFWDRKRGYGLARLKTTDTRPLIQTCAPCHARRSVHAPNFRPTDNFYDYFNNELLAENTYYADGQILDEDYVFGSFIQSKMYHKDIRCTDCHNPHTAGLKEEGNKVCTSCHQHPAAKYDTPAHHFHKSDSTGASCVECHMPEATYMEVDPRRDHSIRIPRPDLSVTLGLPNACTRCHISDAEISDEKRQALKQYNDWIRLAREGDEELRSELARIDQYMLESMQEWYKKENWGDHFAFALAAGRRNDQGAEQLLAELATDRQQPAIARATALFQRSLLAGPVSNFQPELEALSDPDPQVRTAAVGRFYDQIPTVDARQIDERQLQALQERMEPMVRPLVPLLDDPRRVVRREVGRVLARVPAPMLSAMLSGIERARLGQAIEEYEAGVLEMSERGGSHLELAVHYEAMGRTDRAKTSYENAIRVEPGLTGPRSNLAALLDRESEREANGALQDIHRRGGDLDQLIQVSPEDAANLDKILESILENGADLDSGTRERVARALNRVKANSAEAARLRLAELKLLERDVNLLPDNAALQYRYGLSLHLHKQPEKARRALEKAVELQPNNPDFLYALALLYDNQQEHVKAVDCVERALRLSPGSPQYEALRDQLQAKMENGGR